MKTNFFKNSIFVLMIWLLNMCSSMKFNFNMKPVSMQCLAEYLTTGTLGMLYINVFCQLNH
jgi:hypothetical protein